MYWQVLHPINFPMHSIVGRLIQRSNFKWHHFAYSYNLLCRCHDIHLNRLTQADSHPREWFLQLICAQVTIIIIIIALNRANAKMMVVVVVCDSFFLEIPALLFLFIQQQYLF